MLKIDIIAAGRMRRGLFLDLAGEYRRRIRWPLTLHEIESKAAAPQKIRDEEERKMLELLGPQAFVIALDEKGEALSSLDFSRKIETLQEEGRSRIQFVIGGADGHGDKIRTRADLLLSFGRQTWPHMLARIMLLEQIYRSQQILSGHPYHRE